MAPKPDSTPHKAQASAPAVAQPHLTWRLVGKEHTWSLSLPWVMLPVNYGNDGPVLESRHNDLLCSEPSLLGPNAHYRLFISHLQSNYNTAFPRQWKRRGSLLSTQTLWRSLSFYARNPLGQILHFYQVCDLIIFTAVWQMTYIFLAMILLDQPPSVFVFSHLMIHQWYEE